MRDFKHESQSWRPYFGEVKLKLLIATVTMIKATHRQYNSTKDVPFCIRKMFTANTAVLHDEE